MRELDDAAPPFLERDDALRVLTGALSATVGGSGRVALVCGEAGIGKTTFVQHFLASLPSSVRVLAGAAEDMVSPRPLGPFREMLAGATASLDRDGVVDHLLAELALGSPPAVMVVEDAHWADDATLDVLRYVGRRAPSLPLLLVVTLRQDELETRPQLRRLLGALVGAHVVRCELAGLSQDAVGALAATAGVDVARLAGLGGNPFYITEVLANSRTDLPATVRDAVVGRLLTLPAVAREMLELVSVVPRAVEVDLLERIVPRALDHLDRAERIGLARVEGTSVSFRHELARRSVESTIAPGRRLRLSRQVLGELELMDADPAVLLHHAVTSQDSAAIARHAPAAARAAARDEAHREAEDAARRALELARALPAAAVAEMHGLRAQALYALGRFPDAVAHAEAAVVCLEASGTGGARLAESLLLAARLNTMVGRPVDSRLMVERALAALQDDGPSVSLAAAHELLANLDVIAGKNDTALDHAHQAVTAARDVGARKVEARTRMHEALALVGVGDLAGLRLLEDSVDELRTLGCHEHQARAASSLGVCLIWLGRHAEAAPWLHLADRVARDHGLDFVRFHAQANLAHLAACEGRWADAEAALRMLLTQDVDAAALRVLPLAFLGRLLARTGDPESAPLIEEACERAVASGQVRRIAAALSARLEHSWLTGDRETCLATAHSLVDLGRRAHLVQARGEAMRMLRRCGEAVQPFPGCPEALAAGIRGEWEVAADAWHRLGQPYERALELVESHDADTAAAGVQALDRLGARATADRARQMLRERGLTSVPARPRAARDQVGLTGRQREILDLVERGLTSPEIAQRLFLSRRTVDNHVAAILEHLGVGSRREALTVTGRRSG